MAFTRTDRTDAAPADQNQTDQTEGQQLENCLPHPFALAAVPLAGGVIGPPAVLESVDFYLNLWPQKAPYGLSGFIAR